MACQTAPAVTNSKAATLTNLTDLFSAFYECMSGFSMSGSPLIYCNVTLGVWDTAPSCSVINDNVYVYNYPEGGNHEWWYYFLAAILTALVLLLLALVIWCCCWAPRSYFYDCSCCCFRQRSRRLQDRSVHNNSRERKDVFWIDSNDNKYWSNQALGHYLYSDNSQNGSLTSLLPNRRPHHLPGRGSIITRDIGVEAQLDSPSTSQIHSSRSTIPRFSGGSQKSSTILMGNSFRPVMTEVDTPDRSMTSKGGTKEIQVNRAARPAKDPTKDTKIWMPHSHSIRSINTSTK